MAVSSREVRTAGRSCHGTFPRQDKSTHAHTPANVHGHRTSEAHTLFNRLARPAGAAPSGPTPRDPIVVLWLSITYWERSQNPTVTVRQHGAKGGYPDGPRS